MACRKIASKCARGYGRRELTGDPVDAPALPRTGTDNPQTLYRIARP